MKTMKKKFRGWDKRNKNWISSTVVSDCLIGTFDQPISISSYEWAQFTGMYDESDREIYEGDLVTLWLGNYPFGSGLFEVVFRKGGFQLYAHEVDGVAGTHFPRGKTMVGYDKELDEVVWDDQIISRYKYLGDFGKDTLEVIGNIFENPDFH